MKYPYIVKTEIHEHDGASVKIAFNKNMVLWFDVQKDYATGEITGDWNKYIFYTTNEQDMKRCAVCDTCTASRRCKTTQ